MEHRTLKRKRGRFFRLRHIRSKLLLSYALILIIPVVAIGYGFLYVFDEMLLKQETQRIEKEALVLSENIKYTVGGIGDVLADFCSDTGVWQYFYHEYSYPETSIAEYFSLIQPIINSYRKLHPEILSATVYTTNESVVTNESEISYLANNSAEESLYRLLAENGTLWTMTTLKRNGKQQLVAARIVGLYQKPVGLFVLTLDQEKLQSLIDVDSEDSNISIVSHEGNVVLSTLPSLQNYPIEDTELAGITNNPGQDARLQVAGVEQQAQILPFEVMGCETDWYLIRMTTMSSLRRVADANYRVAAALCVIILFLMACMSILFAQRLTKRLAFISDGILHVEKGDFTVRVNVGGADEVSRLGESLNQMTGRLNTLVQENAQMQMQQRELEITEREARINALQSQINPHFLFNTLEAVEYGIHSHLDGTEGIVRLLARNMRRIAVWDNEPTTLREELLNVREHLTIQKYRYGEKLRYCFDIDDTLLEMQIPKLLLQPLVENAVTHGIAMKPGGGEVRVIARRGQNSIVLAVEDDGAGMDELTREELYQTLNSANSKNRESIGLKNVADRIRLIYDGRAQLVINSTEDIGTSIVLTIREGKDENPDCGR